MAHWQLTRIARPLRDGIYTSIEQLDRTLTISDQAQQIFYLNEARFQSARNYAFTGDRQFEEQYHLSRFKLAELLRQLSHRENFPIEIVQNSLALAAIEQEAIQKVKSGPQGTFPSRGPFPAQGTLPLRSDAIAILEDSAYKDLQNLFSKRLRDYFESIGASYEKAYESAVVNARLATERTDNIVRDSIRLNLIMVFVLIGIAVGISMLIGRQIAGPILLLKDYVTEIAISLSEGKPHREISIMSEDEIGDLTRAFLKMTDDLQKTISARDSAERDLKERGLTLESVNKEMETFTYTVSHDLRAPLRAISSFANCLEAHCKDSLSDAGRGHLSQIKKGIVRMTRLIDDLLILSRITRVQNPYDQVDINQLVERIKRTVAANFPETNVEFLIETDLPTVYCDPIKLEVVYVNLISNAIKFSSKTGRALQVMIGYNETDNEHAFYVADNGIGIEPRYHAQIFGFFNRLHTQEEYEGTGAGLTIVKNIIEDHKGRITVESNPNQGAKFIFTIPKGTPAS
jgi:signal transduction histidine kinase